MEFFAKEFLMLSQYELYEILKSRAEIFLLEQNIICQDMDDVDKDSLHCYFAKDGRVIAYLRAFKTAEDTVTVGRVLTLEHGKGHGTKLMEHSITEIKKHFGCKKISLHAQKRSAGFYEKLGFSATSGEFLEAGVVHITMEKEI